MIVDNTSLVIRRRNRRRSPFTSGFRPLRILDCGLIIEIPDGKLRKLEYVDENAYAKYFAQFSDPRCSITSLKQYIALLKADLAIWNAWISSMQTFKSSAWGSVIGVALTLLATWIIQSHIIRGFFSGYLVLFVGIVVAILFLTFINIAAANVLLKIERATLWLEIAEDVLAAKQSVS